MKHTKGTAGRRAGRFLALALSAAMVLSSAGCAGKGGSQPSGQAESGQAGAGQTQAAAAGSGKIVNIGVTSSLNTLNPLLMDGVEMNKYASETLKTRACYYYLLENDKLDIYRDYLTGQISRDQLYASVPEGLLDIIINKEISSSNINEIFGAIDEIVNTHALGEIDLIIGGPPCQAYSLMGRAVDAKNMQKDPRN